MEAEDPGHERPRIGLPPGDPDAIRAIARLLERAGGSIERAQEMARAAAEGEPCDERERLEVSVSLAVIEREMVAFTDPERAFGDGPLARAWRETLPRWTGVLAYARRGLQELPVRGHRS